jgi:hypothetical protein
MLLRAPTCHPLSLERKRFKALGMNQPLMVVCLCRRRQAKGTRGSVEVEAVCYKPEGGQPHRHGQSPDTHTGSPQMQPEEIQEWDPLLLLSAALIQSLFQMRH